MTPKTIRRISRLHKLLALLIGLPLLFWVSSGFYFTLFPIEEIRGEHLRAPIDHGELDVAAATVTLQEAASIAGIAPESIELKMFLGEPVWQIADTSQTMLISAATGDIRSPISKRDAMQIAEHGAPGLYASDGNLFLMTQAPPREYGGRLPAWVFETATSRERIYIEAMTGDIRAIRTTEWRIFDILWRFHILDITGADDFGSWWLKLAAAIALFMVITGFLILAQRASRRKLLS